jgi:hypothetical protein
MKAHEGVELELHSFLSSAPKEVSGNLHTPATLSSKKNHGTHWVGPRTGLDVLEKRKISCRARTFIILIVSVRGKKDDFCERMRLTTFLGEFDHHNATETPVVKNFLALMKPEGSLPCSQKPFFGP